MIIIKVFYGGMKLKNRIRFEKFISEDDFHYFLDLALNEKVQVMNYGRTFALEEAKQMYECMLSQNKMHESFGYFKVFEKTTNIFIGYGALTVNDDLTEGEIEYMLLPEHWGKGFGSEIAGKLLRKAEEAKSILKVTAIIGVNNISSRKILIKSGFVLCRLSENPDDGSQTEIFSKEIVRKANSPA